MYEFIINIYKKYIYDSQFVNVLSLQDQLQECIDAMFERKVRINLPMLITGFKLQHKF